MVKRIIVFRMYKLIKYIHYFLLFSGEAGAEGLFDLTDFFAKRATLLS